MAILRVLPRLRVRLHRPGLTEPADRKDIVKRALNHFLALQKQQTYQLKHAYLQANPWWMQQVFEAMPLTATPTGSRPAALGTVILDANPHVSNLAHVTFLPASGQNALYGSVQLQLSEREWVML
jgi:uncharacterized protein VirK/YbjX